MTLKTVRIVSLSITAAGAIFALVFAFFEMVKVAMVFIYIMAMGWILYNIFNRCPECKGHLRGPELYCPHCGEEIDENKKVYIFDKNSRR